MNRRALLLASMLVAAADALAAAPGVSAGGSHSLALHADGTVRAWGDDSAGALGVGRSLVSASPLPVSGLGDVVAVSAGGNHTVALRREGTVWTWGSNETGELGDGSTTARSLPVQVSGLTGIVQISAGRFYTVARKNDGTVWTWGSNYAGELGDDGAHRPVARPVEGLGGVVEISAGPYHVLARKFDGTVWAWGLNGDGQLGDGAPTASYAGRSTPVKVVGLGDVAQIAAGGWHSLARKNDGTVWAWGANDLGQAGDGAKTPPRLAPVQVAGLANVIEISAGMYHSLARDAGGRIFGWGGGGYGNIGDGLYEDRPLPVQLTALTDVAQLAAGFLHSLAVRQDGGLWTWGNNEFGQLGDGTSLSRPTPILATAATGLSSAAVGMVHSVALKRDGTVITWGDNSQGQLGNGVFTFRASPQPVSIPNVTAVAAGFLHSLALTADGRVLAWGSNGVNQLAGEGIGRSRPEPVAGLENVTQISAGVYHSLARISDGTVRAFGSNYRGRLGNGDPDDFGPLSVVRNLAGVRQVSAGGGHSLAVKQDGTVWSWGENDNGQLGDGTLVERYAPVQVVGLTGIVEVVAGPAHSLARGTDGSVWAWGRNVEGQLGDGTQVDRSTPVRVQGLARASALSAGRDFSLALVDGNVWAWGINYNGGLGCTDCDGSSAPTQIPGLTGIRAISAFQFHVLAMRADGSLYAWGSGQLGQLGDGALLDRLSPVVVLRENGGGSVAANDWFLDLDPAVPSAIPSDKVPVFLALATAVNADVTANIRFRPEDVGTTASVFVFAIAPSTIVRPAASGEPPMIVGKATGAKADVQCVLAQLTSGGQLQGVSASSLQAYLTGVLSAQGQAVTIINGVPTVSIGGATFFVGYGPSASAMLNGGTNRGVVTLAGNVQCKPQAPQTGWWWNPAEGGRGYSIEARGNRVFFAAFHYDVSGRSTWHVANGPTSLEGSLYSGELLSVTGGQTLAGPYPGFPRIATAGPFTLAFNDAAHGTMIWPGGAVPIERFNIVPNGLATPPQPNQPENGWWWNEQEAGRGFFIEWQNGWADVAGYMYDASGNPVWYLSVFATPDARTFSGSWWSYANGQTMTGPYRPATRINDNVGAVTIRFSGPENAMLTLPDGRQVPLTRHRF